MFVAVALIDKCAAVAAVAGVVVVTGVRRSVTHRLEHEDHHGQVSPSLIGRRGGISSLRCEPDGVVRDCAGP